MDNTNPLTIILYSANADGEQQNLSEQVISMRRLFTLFELEIVMQ